MRALICNVKLKPTLSSDAGSSGGNKQSIGRTSRLVPTRIACDNEVRVIMNAKFIQSNEVTHECVTDICCTKNSEITSDKETAKNVLFLI